jgi:hypothetical protein
MLFLDNPFFLLSQWATKRVTGFSYLSNHPGQISRETCWGGVDYELELFHFFSSCIFSCLNVSLFLSFFFRFVGHLGLLARGLALARLQGYIHYVLDRIE